MFKITYVVRNTIVIIDIKNVNLIFFTHLYCGLITYKTKVLIVNAIAPIFKKEIDSVSGILILNIE
ncbi:hypothetical protein D3C85_1623380 [compost metagenome]